MISSGFPAATATAARVLIVRSPKFIFVLIKIRVAIPYRSKVVRIAGNRATFPIFFQSQKCTKLS